MPAPRRLLAVAGERRLLQHDRRIDALAHLAHLVVVSGAPLRLLGVREQVEVGLLLRGVDVLLFLRGIRAVPGTSAWV